MRHCYRFLFVTIALLALCGVPRAAASCQPTGFSRYNIPLTAALVNPSAPVTGDVDAGGCDIGVYYDAGRGAVQHATIHGALWFGVVVNGDANTVAVDVTNSSIYQIGDSPFNGVQRGIAIYYRAFLAGSTSGTISGNRIWNYQKGGIVTNGRGTRVTIFDNQVLGLGPVDFIAQNGIQVGYGATASVMRNHVEGNSYTGTSTVSGGIVAVGGPGYGSCPDGNPCPYTTGTQVEGNTVSNNDVGIFLTNIAADGFSAPATATNIKAVNNLISSDGLHNNYGGFGYQAGVSDVGNNDKIIHNSISGAGYDPAAYPSAYVVAIDADPSFTNRPKVHANR